jgi:Domain of unknown function (DUF4360)
MSLFKQGGNNMKFIRTLFTALFLIFISITSYSQTPKFTIDTDSVRVFGTGCPSLDTVLLIPLSDQDEGAVEILFSNMIAAAFSDPVFVNCSVLFDVIAAPGIKIAAPQVILSVDYAIDAGGKGVASSRLTTLGEPRVAKVEDLYGNGSLLLQSPIAPNPTFSSCGGKLTFRVSGSVTAFAPVTGGFSQVSINAADTEQPYSIRCPIIPAPC